MFTSLKRSRAISSFGIVAGIVVSFAAAVPFATAAPAQTAPAANKAQTPNIAPTQWIKVCDPKDAKLCQITEDYALLGAAAPLGSVSIQTSPDPNKFGLGIQVPIGFLLNSGIPLVIDGSKKGSAQFITCLPSPQSQSYFCLAQALVDTAFIDALKKGKSLDLGLTAMDKSVTTLSFPLANFTQTFDGPDQAALARQREDAAKILAEKAKQRAKQLEGQQPKP